ncbi:hypothetical protein E6W39_28705 [Kitasatospora acidiphila]|uniref:Uncharacterized protein n=1 Tax=Kitasatospora acidiphila TaxID=2567942 RepID=A0A540W915_9ACTN|nr:hypothetical protein [Kitasatospora acidiphila]TQF05488.1 hypothetical protein E6W39_28705 [Kitasatospora acidiphila]
MDPVSVGLLVALAGGAGGEMGKSAWSGLSALVRKPFHRGGNSADDQFSSGENELALLNQAPDDTARAQALSTALAVRSALDSEFRAELNAWHAEAQQVPLIQIRDVHNTVSGGNNDFVIQAGNIQGNVSKTTLAPPTN